MASPTSFFSSSRSSQSTPNRASGPYKRPYSSFQRRSREMVSDTYGSGEILDDGLLAEHHDESGISGRMYGSFRLIYLGICG